MHLPSNPQLLKFLLLNGQKSNIERERHGQSFLRFGNTEEIREGMGIDNRMVGYVFLVDRKGRMRWRYVTRWEGKESNEITAFYIFLSLNRLLSSLNIHRGTGRPSEEEIGSMLKCAHELYEEGTANLEASSGKRSGNKRK